MQRRMVLKVVRRRKFDIYRKEQQAVHQLALDLSRGLNDNVPRLVVWGNGGFGPTSKGHASAPNKNLQNALSQFLPVITNLEYNTSQRSACCHSKMTPIRSAKQRTRTTLSRCLQCDTLMSRDRSAAHLIADIFIEQRATQTDALPTWARRRSG